MVSLTPVRAPKAPRPIKLEEPVQFESLDHMVTELNGALSITEGFAEIPKARAKRRIIRFGPKDRKQYKICSEQEGETLVYTFDRAKSMIETVELHEQVEWKKRVEVFKEWYTYIGKSWTWESGEQDKSNWNRGSSKRSQSVPSRLEDRRDPVEQPLPWRDVGDASVDPAFLYPEVYPISVVSDSDKKSKNPRVYCAYCDVNNHARFSRKRYYKHQNPTSKHACTLRMGTHPPFLCPRAQVNGSIAKPNWARKEIKLAADKRRAPNLEWSQEGRLPALPPPVEPPRDEQQLAAPEDAAPLCVAAVAMHGPPPM